MLLSSGVLALVVGCGTVGPPVAPQNIGVGAKLSNEKLERKGREALQHADQSPVQAEQGTSIGEPDTLEDRDQTPGFFEGAVQPNARPGDVLIRPR